MKKKILIDSNVKTLKCIFWPCRISKYFLNFTRGETVQAPWPQLPPPDIRLGTPSIRHGTLWFNPQPLPLLVTFGGHHWRPDQTWSFGETPPTPTPGAISGGGHKVGTVCMLESFLFFNFWFPRTKFKYLKSSYGLEFLLAEFKIFSIFKLPMANYQDLISVEHCYILHCCWLTLSVFVSITIYISIPFPHISSCSSPYLNEKMAVPFKTKRTSTF